MTHTFIYTRTYKHTVHTLTHKGHAHTLSFSLRDTHTLDSDRLRAAFYGFRTLGHDPDQKAMAIISVRVGPHFNFFLFCDR